MVRVQLDLPGAVKEKVDIAEGLELLLEPVHVLLEEFHAVHEAAVRAQRELLHHGTERHKVGEVNLALVQHLVIRGIEVDDHDRPAAQCQHRDARDACQAHRPSSS